ncbi:MAG: MSHA biogenesis protein MshE, partial [Phycisphaerae bacterium]
MIGKRMRLGEQLVADQVITIEQLKEALSRQTTTGEKIGTALIDTGAITMTALVNALTKRLDVKGCVLRHGLIDP